MSYQIYSKDQIYSKAKAKANKRWDDDHKEEKKIYRYRSYARKFIRDFAKTGDLQELGQLIKERQDQLTK